MLLMLNNIIDLSLSLIYSLVSFTAILSDSLLSFNLCKLCICLVSKGAADFRLYQNFWLRLQLCCTVVDSVVWFGGKSRSPLVVKQDGSRRLQCQHAPFPSWHDLSFSRTTQLEWILECRLWSIVLKREKNTLMGYLWVKCILLGVKLSAEQGSVFLRTKKKTKKHSSKNHHIYTHTTLFVYFGPEEDRTLLCRKLDT